MMQLTQVDSYIQDVRSVAEMPFSWVSLQGTTILISGGTGMIGRFLIDVLMYRNQNFGMACKILCIGRDQNKCNLYFSKYCKNEYFEFIQCSVNNVIPLSVPKVDYIFHLASNTHPIAYANHPIETILTNILGLRNLLDAASSMQTKRFIFASTVEVYGENRGDVEKFTEEYSGILDCNSLRAGYPESKRAGEALCQAYIKEKQLDIVIPRLARTFGPTMLFSDSKASSQFINKALAGENIVLKSAGTQFYSYTYVADAVSGILEVFFKGKKGEAYNIADENFDIHLRDLAAIVAEYVEKKVVFDIPDVNEKLGFSKATKAVMDGTKLHSLGWKPLYSLKEALHKTIEILFEYKKANQVPSIPPQ